eukprot:2654879-Amphidinium_carterae.1
MHALDTHDCVVYKREFVISTHGMYAAPCLSFVMGLSPGESIRHKGIARLKLSRTHLLARIPSWTAEHPPGVHRQVFTGKPTAGTYSELVGLISLYLQRY